MPSEMFSKVLAIKFTGVVGVVVSLGRVVTVEVSFVEFSPFTLTEQTIKTIKVNSSFIAAAILHCSFFFLFLSLKDLELVLND